jgi:hypothetical protein
VTLATFVADVNTYVTNGETFVAGRLKLLIGRDSAWHMSATRSFWTKWRGASVHTSCTAVTT